MGGARLHTVSGAQDFTPTLTLPLKGEGIFACPASLRGEGNFACPASLKGEGDFETAA